MKKMILMMTILLSTVGMQARVYMAEGDRLCEPDRMECKAQVRHHRQVRAYNIHPQERPCLHKHHVAKPQPPRIRMHKRHIEYRR